jgi:hypothetical protein
LCRDPSFDPEFYFGCTEPPIWTGQDHWLPDENCIPFTRSIADGEWLDASIDWQLYEQILGPLVEKEGSDLVIMGWHDFMNLQFATAMGAERPERWQVWDSNSLCGRSEPKTHTARVKDAQDKRFWAFVMINNFDAAPWGNLEFRFLDGRQEGFPLPVLGSWKADIFRKGSKKKQRGDTMSWEDLEGMISNCAELTFRIEAQTKRYRTIGVPRPEIYYRIRNQEELSLFISKTQAICAWSPNFDTSKVRPTVNIIVGENPQGKQLQEELEKGIFLDNIVFGNHWFLAIYDKKTNRLFNLNSKPKHPGVDEMLRNLRTNIREFCRLWGLEVPELPELETPSNVYVQGNDNDCGPIALHSLLMFALDRSLAGKGGPGSRDNEHISPACSEHTLKGFETDAEHLPSGARLFRRMMNCALLLDDLATHIQAKELREALSKALQTEGIHPKQKPDQLNPAHGHKKVSKQLEETFVEGTRMSRQLVDRHPDKLDLIRYHLDYAGGVLFSLKNPDDSRRCGGGQCPHLIDIIPVPLNCRVILQP